MKAFRLLPLLISTACATTADWQPFFQKHCVECHDAEMKKGGLDLEALAMNDNEAALAKWARIHDRIASGEMPPEKKPRPEAAEKRAALEALAAAISTQEASVAKDRGRTPLRRLNRTEYENTIRDLLGVEVNVRDILPPDTPSHGFDTVADGLRFSQLQMEKYLEAADTALEAAIVLTEEPKRFHKRMSLKEEKGIRENLDTPEGKVTNPAGNEKHKVLFRELPDAVVMFTTGWPPGDFRAFSAPATGRYRVKASAYAYQSDGAPVTLRIYAHRYKEKRLLGFFEMPAQAREVEFTALIERDELIQVVPHGVGNDKSGKSLWNAGVKSYSGPGLAFQWLEVEGPLGDWPPPGMKALFPDVTLKELPEKQRPWRDGGRIAYELAPENATDSARGVVEAFATRAFRRPLEDGEAEPYVKLALSALEEGRPFVEAVRGAFRGQLTSPQFLLLDEQAGKLTDHALAARLSYFLWSTMPDAELLRLAAEKKLTRPEVLRAQTERLLASPKSQAFVRNFTGQWLDLRNIKATSPDKQLYPEFDEMLEGSMVAETETFFTELLIKNLSVASFIHSDFAMLNRTMARHYGIPGVTGEQFTPVKLPAGSPRGGVLTQAAILKLTANGTVTSPVLRGAWVMKRLLGKPPQPPPPNVGSVEPDTRGASTIRELLDKHRNSDTCASCHRTIDPPGFALESFDVIGGWRERYRSLGQGEKPPWKLDGRDIWEYKLGPPVDASGQLADGRAFKDITEFKQLILADKAQFLLALTGKLLTYATGASIRFSDRPEVERIAAAVTAKDSGLRTLIHAIVQSPVFREK
jgi:hypothetical protein